MIRTFIAFGVPENPALNQLLQRLQRIGSSVRASPIRTARGDELHATLKFLGQTQPERVSMIHESLQRAIENIPSFDAILRGLGAFPDVSRPSVLWVGFADPQPVVVLAGAIECAMEQLGFVPEARAYSPHVTLARVKSRPPQPLFDLLAEQASTEFGTLPVKHVHLYQSAPGPNGPEYTILRSAHLQ
jgi:RNA 2',3'-cyclic 3'-phosphodiesterase